MRVHDVGSPAGGEKLTDARGIDPTEGDDISRRLPDKASEMHLTRRCPDDLSERSRRDRDTGAGFSSSGEQDEDAAVVALERD